MNEVDSAGIPGSWPEAVQATVSLPLHITLKPLFGAQRAPYGGCLGELGARVGLLG